MSETTVKTGIKRISWIIWTTLLVLVILLVSAFWRAWEVHQALADQAATLSPMLTAVMDRQATLQVELTRVQSDAYVEQWARQNARMVQGSEVLVVPLAPPPTLTPTPRPTVIPTPTPTPLPFWQQWWQALGGH
jgi:hypothetical protein